MKIVVAIAAAVLLTACAQQPGAQRTGMSQNQEPPSAFQSVGACEPTAWAGLEQDSRQLPREQRQRVAILLQDAASQHADTDQGRCIMTLQQAEKIVRQGTSSS
jgi:type IV pilus biogenesis protein CpaD/CtpE